MSHVLQEAQSRYEQLEVQIHDERKRLLGLKRDAARIEFETIPNLDEQLDQTRNAIKYERVRLGLDKPDETIRNF